LKSLNSTRALKNLETNPDTAVVIALGGNVPGTYPSSEALLEAALSAFAPAGLIIARRSRWWRSAAWPDAELPEYRNGVLLVETALGPRETLQALHAIETRFGRRRGVRNAPRTLDLDLVAHGRSVLDEGDVVVPHPRAHERRFVMGPLAEIAPDWRHPVLGKTAAELAAGAPVGADATPLV
jgi:2-amino-4-hydroxy-6-hydroxymethyldihydropteridine diphosphokinase